MSLTDLVKSLFEPAMRRWLGPSVSDDHRGKSIQSNRRSGATLNVLALV
jgi:hypothetical protein